MFEDIYYTCRDGLRLHARFYNGRSKGKRPVICLAGLTRNCRDFEDLAAFLSSDEGGGRTVYALDYRGRGQSENDPDWRRYDVLVEMQDVIDLMTIRGLHDAALIGTSRGGLIAMIMATAQPSLVGAVVMNDIGPVIEQAGLARIMAYVGRVPLPIDWPDAVSLVRSLSAGQFPAIDDATWQRVARQMYNDDNGRPCTSYDPQLAKSLSILDGPIPELWPQFEALKRLPVMVIRGALSDILSQATVDEMLRRHEGLQTMTVPGQGHAPLLMDRESLVAIAGFLDSAERPLPPKAIPEPVRGT